MDYKKTAILLKKIKSLHNTLMDNEDQPSSMEQELMKSYLRDFFDSFVSGEGSTDIFNRENEQVAQSPQANEKPQVIERINQPIETPKATESVPPIQTQTSETQHTTHVESPTPLQETIQVAPLTPIKEQAPVVAKEADAKTDREMVVEGKDVIDQLVNDPVDADLIALFNEVPVTDLSGKLALLPINDLTKALSINERFFTIQELFGGNSELFQTTLKKLNGFTNFEQASEDLISSVASEYEWASTAKQKKAANFIKLVRRRYQ